MSSQEGSPEEPNGDDLEALADELDIRRRLHQAAEAGFEPRKEAILRGIKAGIEKQRERDESMRRHPSGGQNPTDDSPLA